MTADYGHKLSSIMDHVDGYPKIYDHALVINQIQSVIWFLACFYIFSSLIVIQKIFLMDLIETWSHFD